MASTTRPTTLALFLLLFLASSSAQSTLCPAACGNILIRYPFGLADGCGSPYYRRLLLCSPSSTLHLRTPSGIYPVLSISYSDPHLVVLDPSTWSCTRSPISSPPPPPFALDTSTHLSLSPKNDYLFLNCSPDAVIAEPKPEFCDRYPDRCGSVCDTSGYLCRNPPGGCLLGGASRTDCCTYYPKASESVRMMLRHCAAYASVYWREVGERAGFPPYEQVPEYGLRVDFEIPVTTRCLQCEDTERGGGGACGFDVGTREFRCLCREGNTTSHCADDGGTVQHKTTVGVIVGTTAAASVAGIASAGVLVWYLRKIKTTKVACGVQSNENRLF